MKQLEAFIVAAKRQCYVGDGTAAQPSRVGSHDLEFRAGDWTYRDSYFGGTDFIGQEVVWQKDRPVWAMNYHGFILRPDLIDAASAGHVIKTALSAMYKLRRFLGGFEREVEGYRYIDRSVGMVERFHGEESIAKEDITAYKLLYHGGLIKG